VDWACHANDPAHMLSDLLAYDKAVAAALDFAGPGRQDPGAGARPTTREGFPSATMPGRRLPRMKVEHLLEPIPKWKSSPPSCGPKSRRKSRRPGSGLDQRRLVHRHHGRRGQSNLDRAQPFKDDAYFVLGEMLCPNTPLWVGPPMGTAAATCRSLPSGPASPAALSMHPISPAVCARAMGFDLEKTEPASFRRGRPGLRRRPCRRGPNPTRSTRGENRLRAGRGETAELPVNKNC